MSSTDEPIRERWTAQTAASGDEATAGALLRLAAQRSLVGERQLAEIHARLRGQEPRRPRAVASPGRRFLRQLVFAGGLLLFGGGLSASVLHVLYKAPRRPAERAAPAAAPHDPRPPSARKARPSRPVAPAEAQGPPAPVSPVVSPAVPWPSSTLHRSRPGRLLAARETPGLHKPEQASSAPEPEPVLAPPPGPSQLARESRLLASAIAKLRQQNDPEQALAILDQHRAEFGPAALAPEATATRIEALLRLGRNQEALALLDAQALTAKGVGREMLVARAELRADRGRFLAALRDFDLLLSASDSRDGITERARFGRATCRAKSGDWEGARHDLESYLSDFPHGRFIDQARAALAPEVR